MEGQTHVIVASAVGVTPTGVDTKYQFLFWGLVILGCVYAIRRVARRTSARQQFATMTDADKANLTRAILSGLYGAQRPVAAITLAKSTDVDLPLMFVALEHLGRGQHIVAANATKEGELEYDDWDQVELTQLGIDLYHRYNSSGSQVHMGDILNVGDNSTVINRSSVERSFMSVSQKMSTAEEQALALLIQEVIASGNADAGEMLESFLDELKRDHPKKSVLRNLFAGIKGAVPAIAASASLVAALHQLVN